MISFKDYLSESKGLHVFDIDETLMKTNAKIHVKDKHGAHVTSLDNQQFNDHKLEHGHHYDFSEFRDSKKFHDESTPIHPMIRKVQKLQHHIKAGDHKSKIIMSTARSDFDDKQPVLDKFKKHGIDMDKIHLHRAGNIEGDHKPAEKKNVILRKHLDTGNYDHVHFYDDSKTNLTHFNKLKDEYPHIKFHAHHVDHEGKTKRFVEERDWHKPQQKANWGGRGTPESRKALAKKFSDSYQKQRKKDEDARMKIRALAKTQVEESFAKQVAVAAIALQAGLPHQDIARPAGESEMWRIPSKGAKVPRRLRDIEVKVPKKITEERFAVVDPKTNKPHFITSDEHAANKVAKQKGMEVRQIFGPKSRNFNLLKLIK